MPERTWPALEVGQLTSGPATDAVSAALMDYDLAAVEETTADAWRVFFRTPAGRDSAAQELSCHFPDLAITPVDVPDEDWAARSQANLRAVAVGGIVVAPPWDIPHTGRLKPVLVDQHVTTPTIIVIRPSMGFGTGHHATTRLCLMALQEVDVRGLRVIDVGSGSGVLAIAASRLGAAEVMAIDDDADAIEAMTDNLDLNRGARVAVRQGDFRSSGFEPFDLVVANLTGTLLCTGARQLWELTARDGRMIFSGFTRGEETAVRAAFGNAALIHRAEEGEWLCVTLQR